MTLPAKRGKEIRTQGIQACAHRISDEVSLTLACLVLVPLPSSPARFHTSRKHRLKFDGTLIFREITRVDERVSMRLHPDMVRVR